MKTRHLLMAAITGMTALCACNDEDSIARQKDSKLEVSASLMSRTRAAIEGNELPENATIGVSLFNQDGTDYDGKQAGYKNIPYTKGTGWTSTDPIILSPAIGKAVAYYPYSAEVNDITAINVETASQTDYLYSDWVENLSYENAAAPFDMNHALCAVQFNIINESYNDGPGVVTKMSVSSAELATTAKLNAMTGTLSAFGGKGDVISLDKNLTISQEMQSTKLIAVPTGNKSDLNVSITMDGKEYNAVVPVNKPFEQGMSYIINFKASAGLSVFEVSSVTIEAWSQESMGDVDLQIIDNKYIIQVEIPRPSVEFSSNVRKFSGTIDWGDGTDPASYTNAINPSHTYAKAGTYTITHKVSDLYGLSYMDDNNEGVKGREFVTDIIYIGKDLGITSMYYAFYGCSKLTNLKPGIFDNLINVTNFGYTFYGCSNIAAIPDGLFDKNTQVDWFRGTFKDCSSLTEIPTGLFDNCPLVKSFAETFKGCASLISIPAGLFDNCPLVTSFGGYNYDGTFYNCSELTEIPQGLFDNNPNVTDFSYTFYGCSRIAAIPQGLFDNCPNVTDFSKTFSGCSKLTTIPAGLFDKCTLVKYFVRTFSNCNSLISIPAGLFDNCTNANNFNSTFDFCISLTSIPDKLFTNTKIKYTYDENSDTGLFSNCKSLKEIPAGLFENCTNIDKLHYVFSGCLSLEKIPAGLFKDCINVTSFKNTFSNCNSLISIPAGLFDNCPNVTSFESTFRYCETITSIPAGLFDNHPNVTNFGGTFEYCKALTEIPAGLFDNHPNVTNFFRTFEYCKALTEIPAGLFDKCTNVTNFAETFGSCYGLTAVPAGLFDKCTLVTDFAGTFEYCKALTEIPAGLFDNHPNVTDFAYTFRWCTGLTGESPYTMIGNKKVHLYERKDYPDVFATPSKFYECFRGCSGLSDKYNIPSDWK